MGQKYLLKNGKQTPISDEAYSQLPVSKGKENKLFMGNLVKYRIDSEIIIGKVSGATKDGKIMIAKMTHSTKAGPQFSSSVDYVEKVNVLETFSGVNWVKLNV